MNTNNSNNSKKAVLDNQFSPNIFRPAYLAKYLHKKVTQFTICLVGAVFLAAGSTAKANTAFSLAPDSTVEDAKLLAPDGAPHDWFGHAVAISGDTAFVGAERDDVGINTNQGSVHVFVRIGNAWTHHQQLTASDGLAHDQLGQSISSSGDTVVIGAYNGDGNVAGSGAAYVFVKNAGGMWNEQAKLTASDGTAGDIFGWAVSVSGDTAIVGAYWEDVGSSNNQGAAYVFVRSGSIWTEQQKLTASDNPTRPFFGKSVEIAGETAIVGAEQDVIGSNVSQGSAYIFVRSGATWTEQQKLTPSDGAVTDHFGFDVALSGDTAIVGSYSDDVGSNQNQGSAYVFARSGTVWTEQQKLTASDGGALDRFGISVSISGSSVIVGAKLNNGGNSGLTGAAYVYVNNGTVWAQHTKLLASDGGHLDAFGESVSISGDYAIVGAVEDDDKGDHSGSAYIFTIPSTNSLPVANAGTDQTVEATGPGGAEVTLDGSGSSDPDNESLTYSWDGPFGAASGVMTNVTIPLGTHIITLTADDGNGGSSTDTVTIEVGDTTAPVVSAPPNITIPATGPTTPVDLEADGNATATDEVGVTSGPTPDNTGPFALGVHVVNWTASDAAGNMGSAPQTVSITPANSLPIANAGMDQILEPTGPAGTQVTLDGSLSSDPDGDTLTFSWDAPFGTAFGAMPDVTIPLGTHEITLTVDDGNGGTSIDTVTAAVLYNFTGFFNPIDNVQINVAKAGRGIPIKFSLNGDKGLLIFAFGYPLSYQIPCSDDEVDDEEIPTLTAGNSSLSYDPVIDQYNYVWKTNKDWKGMCRRLVVKLNDGSIHTADFQFK